MTRHRLHSHPWDTSLDGEVVPLFLALQWAQARAVDTMRPLLDRHGLSMAEFDVLATLRNTPAPHEATPSLIQQEMVITSGGLTKVLHQLEERSLVARPRRDGDHRIKPVRLTAKGKRAVEVAMAAMVEATGTWFRGALSTREIAQLTTLLDRLLQPRQP